MENTGRNGRPRIIALWSAPRSRSTAFLRMMMERDDIVTLHEPFSHLTDFGETVVDGHAVRSEAELIAAIRELSLRTTVFFKDTTDFHYPQVLADALFLREAAHTFIIRHPAEVIASHYALNPRLTVDEIGFGRLHELYTAAAAASGQAPVVVDSDELLDHPEPIVSRYCELVGLDFRADTLQWQPRTRQEWQKAARWHTDAGRTSGFERREQQYADTVDNNPLLASYLDQQLPFYQALLAQRLTVPVR